MKVRNKLILNNTAKNIPSRSSSNLSCTQSLVIQSASSQTTPTTQGIITGSDRRAPGHRAVVIEKYQQGLAPSQMVACTTVPKESAADSSLASLRRFRELATIVCHGVRGFEAGRGGRTWGKGEHVSDALIAAVVWSSTFLTPSRSPRRRPWLRRPPDERLLVRCNCERIFSHCSRELTQRY